MNSFIVQHLFYICSSLVIGALSLLMPWYYSLLLIILLITNILLFIKFQYGLYILLFLVPVAGRTVGFAISAPWNLVFRDGGPINQISVFLPFVILTFLGFILAKWAKIRKFPENPLKIAFALLLFYAAFSLLWAPNFKHSLFQLMILASNMAIYIIAYKTITDKKMHKKVMWCFLLSGIFYCLIAIILYMLESDIMVKSYILFDDILLNLKIRTSSVTPKGFIRRATLLANPNESAFIFNLFISIAVGLFFIVKNKFKQILLAFIIAILISISLLTMSRGGAVALTIMGFFIFGTIRKTRKHFFLFSALFLFSLVVIYKSEFFVLNEILFSKQNSTRIATTINTSNLKSGELVGLTSRLEFWEAGFNSMKNSPFFGLGAGAGNFKYYTLVNHSHNIYLSFIFDFGIVGVVFLFSIAMFVIKGFSAIVKNQSSYFQLMSIAFLSGFVSIGIHGLVDFEYNSPIIWLYAGLAMSTINFAKQEISSKGAT